MALGRRGELNLEDVHGGEMFYFCDRSSQLVTVGRHANAKDAGSGQG